MGQTTRPLREEKPQKPPNTSAFIYPFLSSAPQNRVRVRLCISNFARIRRNDWAGIEKRRRSAQRSRLRTSSSTVSWLGWRSCWWSSWFGLVVFRRAAFSTARKASRTKSRKKYVGDLLRGVFMAPHFAPDIFNIANLSVSNSNSGGSWGLK
jgi:hypothetical protein